MLSAREALDTILGAVAPLSPERTSILEALGSALAEDAVSARDVPGHANSAMDGYAVRAADVASAPTRLRVIGVAAAGALAPPVHGGETVKIMTGGAMPDGADTVVKVEDTDAGSDVVEIRVAPRLGTNVRLAGEDIRSGDTVLRAGHTLGAGDVGVLASIGRVLVSVHRRPRVAIVSTGNELVEADQEVGPAQVVNSNAYALASAIREAGGLPTMLPIARDRPEEIRDVFSAAARFDAILSTGGVSVGDFDFVKPVMDELGVERLFWKVAQKPGKPLTFGVLGGRPYFGLPGNPVSALVCFYLYAWPALRRMAGHQAVFLPSLTATLGEDMRKAEGLTEFIRVRLEIRPDGMTARSTGTQSSGALSSMTGGSALLVGPADKRELRAGERYPVVLIRSDGATTSAPF